MSSSRPRIKVWDSFIRLYHWVMVGLFGALWWSGKNGEMSLHIEFAIVLAALLIVRIGWGLFGSENARFSYFVQNPAKIPAHFSSLFRRRYQNGNTHSSAGSWAIVAMLTLLVAQIITGLFSTDGILFSGPLNPYVSSDTAAWLTDWHKAQFDYILAIVGLHVLAVVVYRLMGVPLLSAMITGYRNSKARQPSLKSGWQAILLTVAVWFILTLVLK
ncbi:cytochrome b/b6 domain-containing protein [Idiomarina seosinensis]|uniref:Cytochrome B n=1 Tax=Idiomarina seosinensis TaxID=281739 RepID=A0A432ZL45_9GAMM|nr:cytochrome b/b6 domain-containing protein [Idiomarina seosinensis]RUO77942.1 cytochrome B [Idiomarina seosinensis]